MKWRVHRDQSLVSGRNRLEQKKAVEIPPPDIHSLPVLVSHAIFVSFQHLSQIHIMPRTLPVVVNIFVACMGFPQHWGTFRFTCAFFDAAFAVLLISAILLHLRFHSTNPCILTIYRKMSRIFCVESRCRLIVTCKRDSCYRSGPPPVCLPYRPRHCWTQRKTRASIRKLTREKTGGHARTTVCCQHDWCLSAVTIFISLWNIGFFKLCAASKMDITADLHITINR